jgi:hypothetical protein
VHISLLIKLLASMLVNSVEDGSAEMGPRMPIVGLLKVIETIRDGPVESDMELKASQVALPRTHSKFNRFYPVADSP